MISSHTSPQATETQVVEPQALTHTHSLTMTHTSPQALPQTSYTHRDVLHKSLSTTLSHRYKNTRQSMIDRYFNKYIDTIILDMYDVYTGKKHSHLKQHYSMHKVLYRTRWGQLQLDGKMMWMSEVLIPMLVVTTYEGHTGVTSAVDIKLDILVNAIAEHIDHYHPPVKKVITGNMVKTRCNRTSLQAYLNNVLNDTKLRAEAKRVLASLDNYDRLEQEVKSPIINRTYLLGLNLQSGSKEVRAAALADQWSYDVNCAVFGIFASVAHELTNKSFPLIQQYITDRTSIRANIALESGLAVEDVKTALISVGFGKRMKNKDSLHRVMATDTGYKLVKEFRKASSVVFKNFKDEKTRGKRLSELFFTWEAELLNEFIFQSGAQPNLTIHDSVVFLTKVNLPYTLSKMQVSFTTHMEYFKIEENQIEQPV